MPCVGAKTRWRDRDAFVVLESLHCDNEWSVLNRGQYLRVVFDRGRSMPRSAKLLT